MKENGETTSKMVMVHFNNILGILYYNNGNRYEGDWVDDKKKGKGICYYANGSKYEGQWKDSKKSGQGYFIEVKIGVFYYNNGRRYEGAWEDGKRNGRGKH